MATKQKVGDVCTDGGERFREVEPYRNKGCKRTEKILACRCLHPGDYCCNCGKPCWSFF